MLSWTARVSVLPLADTLGTDAAWGFQARQLLWFAGSFAVIHGVFSLFVGNGWRIVFGSLSGAAGGTLLYLAFAYILWPHAAQPAVIATFGPPLCLMSLMAANIVEAALLGRIAAEQEREWRSRLNAWMMIVATVWLIVFGLTLWGGLWLRQLDYYVQAALAAGWLTTAFGGLVAASGSKTNGERRTDWRDYLTLIAPYVFLAGLLCLLSFVAGWLVEQSPERKTDIAGMVQAVESSSVERRDTQVTYRATDNAQTPEVSSEIVKEQQSVRKATWRQVMSAHHWHDVRNPDWIWLWVSLLACVTFAGLASCRVDVNEFSLNALYANRLVRCYLGASRRKREEDTLGAPAHCHGPSWNPNTVTGFDPDDDFDLRDLRIGGPTASSAEHGDPEHELHYWGPFPLINTAVNLVAGDRLAWQERQADSFLLSPEFCGSDSLGYRETAEYAAGYAKEKPLSLGRCIATSGAAANPNMGYHSSPAVSALMTVFNVRLGSWLPNPKKAATVGDEAWKSRGPGFLLKWLAIEMFSLTNSLRRYLNISDGGHFENLGVYELVRRRCQLIIVSDAGADPKYEFEDLGGLIRKCRTDFGIDIEIDISQLRPAAGDRTSNWHCAIGTIRYDRVEPTASVGTLIYLKPTLTGDEPTDVQHYAAEHPNFPHQATLDQFFNESQFESYRALGHHCVTQVLGDVVKRLAASHVTAPQEKWEKDPDRRSVLLSQVRDSHTELTDKLVYHTRTQWLSIPPDMAKGFLKSVEGVMHLQKDLRDKRELSALSRDLYQDLPWDAPVADDAEPPIRAADLHASSLMLQVMENTYVGMHLDRHHGHPLNAGWMNLFHRWAHTKMLRRYWPLLRNEYSREFVFFCEREFTLKVDFGEDLRPLVELEKSERERIYEEFRREWPKESTKAKPGRRRGPDELREDAFRFPEKDADDESPKLRACWYVRVRPPAGYVDDDDPLRDGFVAGIIGVRPLANKLKLTGAELKGLGVRGDDFWKLPNADIGTPSQAELDSRLGYELVVWVRPGFRHLKVGQTLLKRFFEKLDDTRNSKTPLRPYLGKGGQFKLAAYFPKSGWRRSEDKFAGVKSMWLTFFSFYGFRRPGSDWPNIADDEVLVWDSER
jgi:hypothetical protein